MAYFPTEVRVSVTDAREQLAILVEKDEAKRIAACERMYRRQIARAAGALDALACSRKPYDPRRWYANALAWLLRRSRRHATAAATWTARS